MSSEDNVKPYNQLWLPTIALGAALALAGYGLAAETQPPQLAVTAQPAPTSAPAAAANPPTAAPTSAPAATAVPQPTAEPNTSVVPSATPAPTSLLPNDVPWVQSAGTIFADDESFELAKHGLPAPAYNFVAAPDGTMVAYASQQGHLIVADVRTGQAIVDDNQSIMPTNFVFSPDSGALAYGTAEGELSLIELPSGTRQPIALEKESALQDPPTTTLMPIAWTNDGLYTQQVIWGSDAPPQGIVRVDTRTGATTEITDKQHYGTAIAPDGKSIALITGSMPLGDQPTTGITLLNVATGQTTQPVAEQPQIIRGLRWSPDGARMLYAVGSGYEASDTRLQVLAVGGPASTSGDGLVIQSYRDIGWSNTTTPIVLTIKPDGLWLYRLELGDEGPNNLEPLLGIPAEPGTQFDGQIIYTPR
jgi:hypothetical protein